CFGAIAAMPSAVLQQLDTFGPERCEKLDYEQASDYARRLTESQYENFTVVSWFLPRAYRRDFHAVYSFCRWADDLGDETGDRQRSLELLNWWRRELDDCYEGRPRHPVFVALRPTIEQRQIPRKPFDDLIDAFIQDQTVTRYETWEQVLDYCTRSADPVGRLVLYIGGYRDTERQQLSDATCTALQLTNFWQDVRRDILERDRVYVPRQVAAEHGLDIDQMAQVVKLDHQATCGRVLCCPAAESMPTAGIRAIMTSYQATLRDLVDRTWPLFAEGRKLLPTIRSALRSDIRLFTLGGESILRMIQRRDFNTLTSRPSLSKGAKLALMMRALSGRLWSACRGGTVEAAS
ncbi:MAG: squalene synthase HpnC, partial [Burkholderiales bacterium]|nr:squalene synthase HpnC [Burkholderiales bacterium]